MSVNFTTEDLNNLATLSRLKLKEEDKPKILEQISSILGYVAEINDIEIKKGQGESKEHINILRDDIINADASSKNRDNILQNTKERAGDYVKVTQVISNSK